MARPASTHPTDGELEILQILWRGPCTLGQICKTLREKRSVAITTVATMLKVMQQKKLVQRKQGKRSFIWSAKTTRQSAATNMVDKLVKLVFDGSAQRLVAHLVDSGQLNAEEQEAVRRMLTNQKK